MATLTFGGKKITPSNNTVLRDKVCCLLLSLSHDADEIAENTKRIRIVQEKLDDPERLLIAPIGDPRRVEAENRRKHYQGDNILLIPTFFDHAKMLEKYWVVLSEEDRAYVIENTARVWGNVSLWKRVKEDATLCRMVSWRELIRSHDDKEIVWEVVPF